MNYELQSRYVLVFNFCSSPSSYVAFCHDNLRLDIAKCRTYLPTELDPEEHYHYMWVQSLQGFHILRQLVRGRVNDEWYIVAEVIPDEFSAYFFEEMWERFGEVLQELDDKFPLGGVSILDLAPLERLGADLGL